MALFGALSCSQLCEGTHSLGEMGTCQANEVVGSHGGTGSCMIVFEPVMKLWCSRIRHFVAQWERVSNAMAGLF